MDLIEFKLDANGQLTKKTQKVWSKICSRILVLMKIDVTEVNLHNEHCTWDHNEDFSKVVYAMSVYDPTIHIGYLHCTYLKCHKTGQVKLTRITLGLHSEVEVDFTEDTVGWQFITSGVNESISTWNELIKNNLN